MATVRVSISSTAISVNPDPVPINNNTSVEWVGDDSTEFKIVFPGGGGRVKSSGLNSAGNYFCVSDDFSNTTGKVKKVKYDVKSGSLKLDPDVEIQP